MEDGKCPLSLNVSETKHATKELTTDINITSEILIHIFNCFYPKENASFGCAVATTKWIIRYTFSCDKAELGNGLKVFVRLRIQHQM